MNNSLEVSIGFGHVVGKVDHSVGVAPFIVVPGDDFNKGGVQLNAGFGVED